jgi:hypothetical protein
MMKVSSFRQLLTKANTACKSSCVRCG